MTATPERNITASPDRGAADWATRSTFGTRGLPWWGSVVLAVLLTAAGTLADTLIWSEPGILFTACYVVGCLLAVALVHRRSLFGPMVQPPLVLALAMPLVVLAVGAGIPEGAGTTATVLAVASPLVSGFPAMASTTVLVLGIGFARIYLLQPAKPRKGEASPEATTRKAAPPDRKRTPEGGRGNKEAGRAKRPEGGRKSEGGRGAEGGKATGGGRKRPPEDGPGRRPPGSGSGPRPASNRSEREQRAAGKPERGGNTGRNAAPGRGRPAAESRGAGRDDPGQAPVRQPPPGKQGARPRSQNPGGRDSGQRGGPQSAQPGRPERGDRPAPPGRGGPRQNPPGRGKPPQRQPGGEPPRGQRRPRRDDG